MDSTLTAPLVTPNRKLTDLDIDDGAVTKYARAGFLSRATFSWMNPLLERGARKTIQIHDVPSLAAQHRAPSLHSRFTQNSLHDSLLVSTLWRSFWRPFLTCGLLVLIRVSVLFVGPSLIRRFTEDWERESFALVGILAGAKLVEVVSSHQYNFQCQKLGMQMRSALITCIFQKGLRLSSASRQSHGVGQIVNYMSVDVQQISDVMLQVHTLWVVPLQMTVAVVILASIMGVAALAGLLVMAMAGAATLLIAWRQNGFQGKIMEARDRRMKGFNESLHNMKVIKLQGWEERFLQGVEDARSDELHWLSKYVYLTAINIFVLWLAPVAACVAIFAACIHLGVLVTPSLAFTTIATVRILQEPLRFFPQAVIAVTQAMVSLKRLDRYFWSVELDLQAVGALPAESSGAICVESASFKWDPDAEKLSLSDINMTIPHGSLVAVVGKVGSGKTSLLAALLGEMHKITGKVGVSGRTAYVAQSAWIQQGTIEDNILFGLPMDHAKYENTLQVCALVEDLGQMKLRDKTEIGERGINLSGGQRQRVQLARAVYQDCDVYLLDDIFSALDAHTGSQIFEECILGALAGKTIVLVTHQIGFLPRADSILVMRDGAIVQSGQYESLLSVGLDFESLVKIHNEALERVDDLSLVTTTSWDHDPEYSPFLESQISTNSTTPLSSSCESTASYFPPSSETLNPKPDPNPLRRPSSQSLMTPLFVTPTFESEGSLKLIEDEERATGCISGGVYKLYLTTAYGGAIALFLVFTQVVWQFFQISGDYWVAFKTSGTTVEPAQEFEALQFLAVYTELAIACVLCVLIRSTLVAFTGLLTSQKFYLKMLHGVFRAPMSFFDSTPTGRMLSRASTDQAQLDILIPILFGGVLAIGFATAGIFFVVVQVTWQILIIIVPLTWLYYSYQAYYIKTSRELTRVDAVTKAPVIHHFSETIAGLMTIRCFGQQSHFARVNMQRVDTNLSMDFHNNGANEWVGFRFEVIGMVILCVTTVFLVAIPRSLLRPELVGLSLSYVLLLNATLYNVVWLVSQLENKMVSVERIAQYSKLPSEAPAVVEQNRPPKSWPSKGTIRFKDLKLKYRPNTPLVLKGITATIKGGTKVGVVGRTGSGKSSLVLALFRLVEASSGSITIDGIDISTLGLRDLRSKLSIVPQDPTLFDGTIRSNLDPMCQYSDQEIWEVLHKCQLASIVQQLHAKLESPVLENGENWSVGQRQLFCLGRALLKRSSILVLDEATASVDADTDAMIQRIAREEYGSCTVISIAHRMHTVMDSDQVLILEAGILRENGKPSTLLQQPSSLFASLVHEHILKSCSAKDIPAHIE
ncbi:hypothetical protein M758_3G218000 [Ceratodon purpureus]|nr:hypothetical protein M758_3G218000 [Ceratodon purpureus]